MQKITYTNKYGDSITFGNTSPYFLEKIDGNSLSVNRTTVTALQQDGQTTTNSNYGVRTIICDLAFIGVSGGKYDKYEMLTLWQEVLKTIIPKQTGILTYQNDIGTYKIECYPYEVPNYDIKVATFSKFQLEFVADNPFWLSEEQFALKLGQVTGGIQYPLIYPIQYGEWITTLTLENDTNIELPCVVEVSTNANYVKVINNTTGEFIQVEKAITENQKLIIDTGNYTVEIVTYDDLGVEVSREYANYRLTYDSTYFNLAIGENELSIENGIAGATIPATVKYRKRYLGV